MAITYDASSSGGNTGTGTLTVSHTCTGNDRALVVSASAAVPNGVAISGVTYAGVSMTLVDTIAIQSNVTQRMFYLLNPASGANDIVLSVTGANGSTAKRLAAASYTGVKQSAQPDATTKTGPATSSTITGTLTTVADSCWLVASGHGNTSVGAGTGTTQRAAQDSITGVFDSNGAKSPAGSYSLQVTNGGADNGGIIVLSFAPTVETSVSVSVLDATADMPSQSVSLSQSVAVSALDVSADMPDVALSLQPVTAQTLDAAAEMPDVSFEQASSVYVSVLDASADMPAPVRNGGLWSFDGRNSTSWTYDSRNIE